MIPETTNMSQPSVVGIVLPSALVVLLLSSNDLEARTENNNQIPIFFKKRIAFFHLAQLHESLACAKTNRQNEGAS